MDTTEQRRVLDTIAQAAKEEGCLVAPVGSVYFLLAGTPRATTKDVDAVVHGEDLQLPSVDVLKRIAARLGPSSTTTDGAVVQVRSTTSTPAEIELIRGRSRGKGGFFPRELLVEAAKRAVREGNILLYPIEYVLVLKADGAVDREDRARRDTARAAEHERRANAFRSDVFSEVNAALLAGRLSHENLVSAMKHIKASRRDRVRQLLVAAGASL